MTAMSVTKVGTAVSYKFEPSVSRAQAEAMIESHKAREVGEPSQNIPEGAFRIDRTFFVGGAKFARVERFNSTRLVWEFAYNARAESTKLRDDLDATRRAFAHIDAQRAAT